MVALWGAILQAHTATAAEDTWRTVLCNVTREAEGAGVP